MKYTLVTPATVLPVSVSETKTYLRVESYSDHDTMIESLIKSVSREFENKTNSCLTEQTWRLYLEYGEVADDIRFYKFPVKSISSIKYYDDDNEEQTLDSGNYTVVNSLRPTQIIIDDVPSVYDRTDAMVIEFVAGFTNLPEDIKLALQERVYKMYNDPNDFTEMRTTHFEKVARDYRSYDE